MSTAYYEDITEEKNYCKWVPGQLTITMKQQQKICQEHFNNNYHEWETFFFTHEYCHRGWILASWLWVKTKGNL